MKLLLSILLPALLTSPALATECTSCPNKLPTLGDPILVPKLKPGPAPAIDIVFKGSSEYPFWTNSPCDMDNPHPAVEGRLWQEIEFPGPNQCVNFQQWKPYAESGYTFRVGDFSVLPGEDEMPCRVRLFGLPDCGEKKVLMESRVETSAIDTLSRCWSHDTQIVAKSAMMYCGWAEADGG